jgi:hypothetical protein
MDSRTLPDHLTRSRWLGLAVGVTVLVAWAIFLYNQLDALLQYSWRIAPFPFGLSIIGAALYFGGFALCWALLLRNLVGNRSTVSLVNAARIWSLSMITRYVPGNVWHILSRVALAHQLRVPAAQVLTSATVEQILTILSALVLFGITFPFWGITAIAQAWLLVLLPIGLLLLHPRIMGTFLGWAALKLRRPELAWRYTYGELLLLLLAFIGATFFAGLSLVTLVWGLVPANTQHIPLLVGAAALSWVVGYLSFFTPSGLGVREAMLTAILAQIYPLPIAIVGSLLFRLVMTLGEVLAVLVVYGYDRFTVSKERDRI